MRRALPVAVLLLGIAARLSAAQQPSDAAANWLQQANAALKSDNALGQLTASFFRQITNGTKAAAPAEGAIARNALANIRDSAASSPLLTMDWGNMTQAVRSFQGIDTAPAFTSPDWIKGGAKLAASVFVNELASPGAKIVERAQQLGQIATDIVYGSEACGAYTFNPGGAPVNAQWVGPTFTLTQTTGSCVVRTELAGEGNTRWTRLQESLACIGPATQYAWTPLTYQGVSRERTSLTGPECKTEYKFGTEATITLYGGDSKDKVTYASEKEFYAAMVVNKTFDFKVMHLKTALKNVQVKLDASQAKWHDALFSEVDTASKAGATHISGADLADKVTQRYQRMKANMESASNFMGKWTNADGSFKQAAFLQQLEQKIAAGGAMSKGVGRSLFSNKLSSLNSLKSSFGA